MKKIFLIFFLTIFFGGLLLPLTSLAQSYNSVYCPKEYIAVDKGKKCCPEKSPLYWPDECPDSVTPDRCCSDVYNCTDCSDEATPISSTIHTITYDGLVPCGKQVNVNGNKQVVECQFCHFFVMFDRIIKFILFNLVPPIAVLIVVIAGVMFFLAADNPENVNKATSIFKALVIGLIITYGAWVLINLFFLTIGVASWTKLIPKNGEGWFIINCQVDISDPAPSLPEFKASKIILNSATEKSCNTICEEEEEEGIKWECDSAGTNDEADNAKMWIRYNDSCHKTNLSQIKVNCFTVMQEKGINCGEEDNQASWTNCRCVK